MPAGKPDPVSNCSVANQSYSTMSVTCKYGFNGGLRQVYHKWIFNESEHILIWYYKNISKPYFKTFITSVIDFQSASSGFKYWQASSKYD
jgi:hypothetical protein